MNERGITSQAVNRILQTYGEKVTRHCSENQSQNHLTDAYYLSSHKLYVSYSLELATSETPEAYV